MFQISLSPCATKSANSFGTTTHRVSRGAQPEAAGDVFERGPAEHSQAVVEAVGAQLVKLRAVSAVFMAQIKIRKPWRLSVSSSWMWTGARRRLRTARSCPRGPAGARPRPRAHRTGRCRRAEFTAVVYAPAGRPRIWVLNTLGDRRRPRIPVLWNDRVDGRITSRGSAPRRMSKTASRPRLGRDAMRELFRAYGPAVGCDANFRSRPAGWPRRRRGHPI